MPSRQTIVRNRSKLGKSRVHDLLMVGWARCIARYGKEPFADALDVTTAAIDKHLKGSMPDFATIIDAASIDDQVLDEIADALGVRIVPKDAVCCVDDLNLLLSRALVKLNEAIHPDSPGGREIVHTEFLDGEEVMRALYHRSGEWLERCAQIRKPRSVAA